MNSLKNEFYIIDKFNLLALAFGQCSNTESVVNAILECPYPPKMASATDTLKALLDDLEFLPSSEDSQHVVWVSLRHVQEAIDNRIEESKKIKIQDTHAQQRIADVIKELEKKKETHEIKAEKMGRKYGILNFHDGICQGIDAAIALLRENRQ